jgi:putative cardiolipin synthase
LTAGKELPDENHALQKLLQSPLPIPTTKDRRMRQPSSSRTPPRAVADVRRMLVKLLLFAALFALLSIAPCTATGFAERSLGAPGTAFARGGRCHPARPRAGAAAGAAPAASGTALIDDNLEAFALRALSARSGPQHRPAVLHLA